MKKNKGETKVSVSLGGGFTGLLTITFIVLKLCGVINWSWIWVLSPLWIGFGLLIIMLMVMLALAIRFDIWR